MAEATAASTWTLEYNKGNGAVCNGVVAGPSFAGPLLSSIAPDPEFAKSKAIRCPQRCATLCNDALHRLPGCPARRQAVVRTVGVWLIALIPLCLAQCGQQPALHLHVLNSTHHRQPLRAPSVEAVAGRERTTMPRAISGPELPIILPWRICRDCIWKDAYALPSSTQQPWVPTGMVPPGISGPDQASLLVGRESGPADNKPSPAAQRTMATRSAALMAMPSLCFLAIAVAALVLALCCLCYAAVGLLLGSAPPVYGPAATGLHVRPKAEARCCKHAPSTRHCPTPKLHALLCPLPARLVAGRRLRPRPPARRPLLTAHTRARLLDDCARGLKRAVAYRALAHTQWSRPWRAAWALAAARRPPYRQRRGHNPSTTLTRPAHCTDLPVQQQGGGQQHPPRHPPQPPSAALQLRIPTTATARQDPTVWLRHIEQALRQPGALAVAADGSTLTVHPQLVELCEAAVASTWQAWHTMPTHTAEQLARCTRDLIYARHINVMQPAWRQHAQASPGMRILHTTPDGDCFFYSASLLLTGSERDGARLRLHTAAEMLLNINHYQTAMEVEDKCRAAKQAEAIKLMRMIAGNMRYVPARIAPALAQVVGRAVRVHVPNNCYPGMDVVNAITAVPGEPTPHRPLDIAWEYYQGGYLDGTAQMPQELNALNHFVAVALPAHDRAAAMPGPTGGGGAHTAAAQPRANLAHGARPEGGLELAEPAAGTAMRGTRAAAPWPCLMAASGLTRPRSAWHLKAIPRPHQRTPALADRLRPEGRAATIGAPSRSAKRSGLPLNRQRRDYAAMDGANRDLPALYVPLHSRPSTAHAVDHARRPLPGRTRAPQETAAQ